MHFVCLHACMVFYLEVKIVLVKKKLLSASFMNIKCGPNLFSCLDLCQQLIIKIFLLPINAGKFIS